LLGDDIVTTHSLPPLAYWVAVGKSEAGIGFFGQVSCAEEVLAGERGVAVYQAFAVVRKYDLVDQAAVSALAGAGAVQRKAEILLAVGSEEMRGELVVSLARHRGA
jgi:hypothetical protein